MFSSEGNALIPGGCTHEQTKPNHLASRNQTRPQITKTSQKSAETAWQKAPAPGSLSSRCVSCADPTARQAKSGQPEQARAQRIGSGAARDLRRGDQIGHAP